MAATKTSAVKNTAAKKTTAAAKPVAKKAAAAKPAVKAAAAAKKPETKETLAKGFSVPMLDINGDKAGTVVVADGVLNAAVNAQLIALAVRVYLANQREGSASTKTRGEVAGSTRKLYKQKGTGRARHGSIRANIFVHGGIVFGPKPHSFTKSIPEAMRRKALVSALSQAYADKRISVVDDWSALKGKTKAAAEMLGHVGHAGKTLLIVDSMKDGVVRISRNIEGVTVMPSDLVSTYDVVTNKTVVCSKASIEVLAARVTKEA